MAALNKNEEVMCHECGALFAVYFKLNCCDQQVQTVKNVSAYEEHFKDRIDFENYRIFSSSVCVTTTDFFNAIEEDFTVLVNHLLLEHTAFLVNVNFFALYHEDSLIEDNKYIAEVKMFDVNDMELTKNTDVNELYKDIVNSLIFQSDELNTSESSWTLEELLYIEIIKVKKLFENEFASNSLVEIFHHNDYDNLIEIC